MKIEPEPRLRETWFGKWEGLTWAQILERHPEVQHAVWHDPGTLLPNGGETWHAVRVRMRAALDDLIARPQERICAVSHAGAIHAAFSVLFGERSPVMGMRLEPACVNRIRFESDGVHAVTVNDVTHLAML